MYRTEGPTHHTEQHTAFFDRYKVYEFITKRMLLPVHTSSFFELFLLLIFYVLLVETHTSLLLVLALLFNTQGACFGYA